MAVLKGSKGKIGRYKLRLWEFRVFQDVYAIEIEQMFDKRITCLQCRHVMYVYVKDYRSMPMPNRAYSEPKWETEAVWCQDCEEYYEIEVPKCRKCGSEALEFKVFGPPHPADAVQIQNVRGLKRWEINGVIDGDLSADEFIGVRHSVVIQVGKTRISGNVIVCSLTVCGKFQAIGLGKPEFLSFSDGRSC